MNMLIATVTYLLSALTCLACAFLLLRGYLRTRARLLLWSGLCFVALGANNLLLYVDLMVFPHLDLRLLRNGASLAGVVVLLYGLIWDVRE